LDDQFYPQDSFENIQSYPNNISHGSLSILRYCISKILNLYQSFLCITNFVINNSIALPLPNNANIRQRWAYLHRGTNSIAFRLPNKQELLDFLKSHGPLVAPSANPEGLPPAQTIAEAKNYFGNNLDFYIGGAKRLTGPASTLLYWDGEKMRQIR
jgi:hypothetical protein